MYTVHTHPAINIKKIKIKKLIFYSWCHPLCYNLIMFYEFKKELREGIIVDRPNRFIMEIMIDGKRQKAHCPSTGRIGNFDFKNTPCLVSESDNKTRKTKFTVEAVSSQIPEKKNKK